MNADKFLEDLKKNADLREEFLRAVQDFAAEHGYKLYTDDLAKLELSFKETPTRRPIDPDRQHATTLAVGEEDKRSSTEAVGEEDPKRRFPNAPDKERFVTQAIPEEGVSRNVRITDMTDAEPEEENTSRRPQPKGPAPK